MVWEVLAGIASLEETGASIEDWVTWLLAFCIAPVPHSRGKEAAPMGDSDMLKTSYGLLTL